MKFSTISFILSCLFVLACRGEIIPDARLFSWSPAVTVGVPGGIDRFAVGGANQRTNVINVTSAPYNADNSGVTNAATAIASAISAASSNDVVYLPAGTYRIDSTVNLGTKDYVTMRGAGPSQTIIKCYDSAAVAISDAGGSDYLWDWPTNAYVLESPTRGMTNIVLSIEHTRPPVDRVCEIRLMNSTNAEMPVVSVSGYEYVRKVQVAVVGRTATNITIWPPLPFDLPEALQPRFVYQAQTALYCGLEGLSVDMTNSTSTVGIGFTQTYGCWIKDVHVYNTLNYNISFGGSYRSEIRQCWGHTRRGQGSNGAALLFGRSSACLIEDNIFGANFPIIEVNSGSCQNVFAYNYLYDSEVFGSAGVAIDSNHAPHNSFNLYEGNMSPNLQCDGYFGGASEDTVFRNWFTGEADDGGPRGLTLNLNRFTRNYSLVGNILGRANGTSYIYPELPISDWGMPNMGNFAWTGTAEPSTGDWWADWGTAPGAGGFQELDKDVFNTLILLSNWNTEDGAVPAGEALDPEDVLPNSLFRSSRPDFFGAFTWPPFTPSTATVGSYSNLVPARIPAQQAFLNGGTWQTQRRATAGTVNVGTLNIQ